MQSIIGARRKAFIHQGTSKHCNYITRNLNMTGCSRSALSLIVLLAKKEKKEFTLTVIELDIVMENISVSLAYEVKPH